MQPQNGFPLITMTGAAGNFAKTLSDCIEAPAQFLYMAYLTCLGSVLSPALRLKSVLPIQPRLFTLLVGDSATERKSTTLNQIARLFKSVLGEDFVSCWGVGSAEGLERVLNKRSSFDHRTLGTVLVFDELKGFVSKCSIESSVLLPTVNTLFESNHFESHTKKVSVKIENAYLSMLAATTLATYERIYTPAFLDIGFPNRIFIVPGTARKQYAIPRQLACNDEEALKNDLLRVLQHVGDGLELDFSDDARRLYDSWYLNLEDSVHAKRLDTYSLRLAMLLAANNRKCEIDLETVEDALRLCDWQLEVRKIHDPIDADSRSAKLEERIRRCLRSGPLSDRDLKKRANANRDGLFFFDRSMKTLQRAGEIWWNKAAKAWEYRGA